MMNSVISSTRLTTVWLGNVYTLADLNLLNFNSLPCDDTTILLLISKILTHIHMDIHDES